LLASGLRLGQAADARHAKLPDALSHVPTLKKLYPALWRLEMARKDGVSWERLRRGARELWMRSHACADATLERRYRRGARSSWDTVVATWACDGVDSGTQSFLTCIADHEGGRTHPAVWYGGSTGWQGGRFIGTDRVVNHFQTRPYHASKVAPGIYDRTVTRETFDVLTDPINAARIAVLVGPGAYATLGFCS